MHVRSERVLYEIIAQLAGLVVSFMLRLAWTKKMGFDLGVFGSLLSS